VTDWTGQRSDSTGRTVFGRSFVKRFALCYQTVVCLSVLSVTLVYCGQMVGWIQMKLGMQVGLGPGHIVVDWDPAELPSPKRGRSPQFSAHIWCGQMAGWIKMPLGREVGLSPSDIVLDGDPARLPERGRSPQFSARVYCGETAGWIRMPLGRQVGLSQSDIVLVGDPAPPPQNGSRAPNFRPCLLWPDCWMDQDATWRGDRSQPKRHCVRWGQAPPRPKGAEPQFSSYVYCGQTARWIKMALGTEVGLGSAQRRCVKCGTSSSSLKGARPPVFSPCL